MVWASRAEQMPQVIARAFEVLSRDGNMDTTHVGLLAAQGQAGTMVRFSKSANLVTLKNVILDLPTLTSCCFFWGRDLSLQPFPRCLPDGTVRKAAPIFIFSQTQTL
jgi:hypothetical protein